MKRRSYSRPTVQFGEKPYSNPSPTVPPQRVELAPPAVTPVAMFVTSTKLRAVAAPPFT